MKNQSDVKMSMMFKVDVIKQIRNMEYVAWKTDLYLHSIKKLNFCRKKKHLKFEDVESANVRILLIDRYVDVCVID